MRTTRLVSIRSLAVYAALLVLPACATKGDIRNLTTEMRAMAARQDSLRMALERQALITQDSLRGTTSQLLEVRGTVNQQLARIQQELGMLRQENAQFAQLLAGIRDQLERVVSRPTMTVTPGTPSGAGGDVRTAEPSNSEAIELFQAGREQQEVRNYAAARRAFNQVLSQYPNSELAPEAQYKLGEILLAEQKPAEALTAFLQVRQIWPNSPKVPDAQLQAAQIHLDQGRREDARRALQIVIETYPDTSAAATAQERLRAIPPGQ
jgi:tol-pal system protein YbgF